MPHFVIFFSPLLITKQEFNNYNPPKRMSIYENDIGEKDLLCVFQSLHFARKNILGPEQQKSGENFKTGASLDYIIHSRSKSSQSKQLYYSLSNEIDCFIAEQLSIRSVSNTIVVIKYISQKFGNQRRGEHTSPVGKKGK